MIGILAGPGITKSYFSRSFLRYFLDKSVCRIAVINILIFRKMSYFFKYSLLTFFLVISCSLFAQTYLQLGLGVRKLNVTENESPDDPFEVDVHGKPFTQATKFLISLGARREISERFSLGMQFTYQKYEMEGDPQDGFINSTALGFNHYRIYIPVSWESANSWIFTFGPEISVLRDHFFVFSIGGGSAFRSIEVQYVPVRFNGRGGVPL